MPADAEARVANAVERRIEQRDAIAQRFAVLDQRGLHAIDLLVAEDAAAASPTARLRAASPAAAAAAAGRDRAGTAGGGDLAGGTTGWMWMSGTATSATSSTGSSARRPRRFTPTRRVVVEHARTARR